MHLFPVKDINIKTEKAFQSYLLDKHRMFQRNLGDLKEPRETWGIQENPVDSEKLEKIQKIQENLGDVLDELRN